MSDFKSECDCAEVRSVTQHLFLLFRVDEEGRVTGLGGNRRERSGGGWEGGLCMGRRGEIERFCLLGRGKG